MPQERRPRKLKPVLRGLIEVSFIMFLFYTNLLMGEFERGNGDGKTVAFALHDVFTFANLGIGTCAALIGYAAFEAMRRRL